MKPTINYKVCISLRSLSHTTLRFNMPPTVDVIIGALLQCKKQMLVPTDAERLLRYERACKHLDNQITLVMLAQVIKLPEPEKMNQHPVFVAGTLIGDINVYAYEAWTQDFA
jgi:hypothetical protein